MSEPIHQGRLAGTRWDPTQYTRFSDHRLRPALTLLERIPAANPQRVYDLGCGTGQVTRLMAERWPDAAVQGIDNSTEMLARAGAEPGRVTWVEGDIAAWAPDAAADVIYSNAALQWLGDHSHLFPRLLGLLAPGGCLAVQMPLSWGLPSHRLMREVLQDGGPGGSPLGTEALRQGVGRKWVDEPDAYYDLLAGAAQTLDIWRTEYFQVLEGENPVVEWVKGTGLRPILNGLDDDQRQTFLAEYTRRVAAAYPRRADGRTIFPFPRLFIVATV